MPGIQDGFTVVNRIRDATVPEGARTLSGAVFWILSVLLSAVAIGAVVVLIIGGVMYLFSFGEEDRAKTAKRLILYAIIGLLIIGGSLLLVRTLIGFFFIPPAVP